MSTNYGDPQTRGRILSVTWKLLAARGASIKLSEVAAEAEVSRQAVYLHFGDRNGLLLALIHHMDETLELEESLEHVMAASGGVELIERMMRLNTEFWNSVCPVAQALEAAQHDDDALGAAWRDRMELRQGVFAMLVQQIDTLGELAEGWAVQEASGVLYAVAHFDTWRELTCELNWSDERYVDAMTRLLTGSLLKR